MSKNEKKMFAHGIKKAVFCRMQKMPRKYMSQFEPHSTELPQMCHSNVCWYQNTKK